MSLQTQFFNSEINSGVGSSAAIARLTISQVRAEMESKSNKDLASSAGKAVTKTAVALVAATARFVLRRRIAHDIQSPLFSLRLLVIRSFLFLRHDIHPGLILLLIPPTLFSTSTAYLLLLQLSSNQLMQNFRPMPLNQQVELLAIWVEM